MTAFSPVPLQTTVPRRYARFPPHLSATSWATTMVPLSARSGQPRGEVFADPGELGNVRAVQPRNTRETQAPPCRTRTIWGSRRAVFQIRWAGVHHALVFRARWHAGGRLVGAHCKWRTSEPRNRRSQKKRRPAICAAPGTPPTHPRRREQPRQSARSGMAAVVPARGPPSNQHRGTCRHIRAGLHLLRRPPKRVADDQKCEGKQVAGVVIVSQQGNASHLHRRHERNSEKELGGGYQNRRHPGASQRRAIGRRRSRPPRRMRLGARAKGSAGVRARYSRARRSYAPRRRRCGRRATRTRNSRQSESR